MEDREIPEMAESKAPDPSLGPGLYTVFCNTQLICNTQSCIKAACGWETTIVIWILDHPCFLLLLPYICGYTQTTLVPSGKVTSC